MVAEVIVLVPVDLEYPRHPCWECVAAVSRAVTVQPFGELVIGMVIRRIKYFPGITLACIPAEPEQGGSGLTAVGLHNTNDVIEILIFVGEAHECALIPYDA